MKNTFFLAILFAAFTGLSATVTSATITYDPATDDAVFSYAVDGDAIVTVGASVGGVALDPGMIAPLTDALNRKVTAGPHSCTLKLKEVLKETRFKLSDLKFTATAWPVANGPYYMAIDLVRENTVHYYATTNDLPEPISSDRWRTTEMLFRKIPAKNVLWQMGTPADEYARNMTDKTLETRHWVKLARNYYMGVFECTAKQWEYVYGTAKNCLDFSGGSEDVWGTRPVDKVLFYTSNVYNPGVRELGWPGENETAGHTLQGSAASFIYSLRQKCGLGIYLDLPTEAQWEFACRGGKGSALYTGDEISPDSVTVDEKGLPTLVNSEPTLEKISRYYLNSDAANITDKSQVTDTRTGTARVGSYEPNAWGLYDMIGNVGEWVLDNRDNFVANTKEEPEVDPVGKKVETLNDKVIRGGAWNSSDLRYGLRSGSRLRYANVGQTGRGFRMCLTLSED